MRSRLRTIGYLLAGILPLYWLAIFILTHIPIDAKALKDSDKLVHFAAYALLAAFIAIVVGLWRRGHWITPVSAIVIAAVYGAFDEYTQQFVGRHMDLLDWIADTAGAFTGALFVYAVLLARDRSRGGHSVPALGESAD